MKVTYFYEVTEKKAIVEEMHCSNCGSRFYKLMREFDPNFPEVALSYHCECSNCDRETGYYPFARLALKEWVCSSRRRMTIV